jgi:hypothetical protein
MGLYKILHPEVFQGNLNKKDYFEGYFFKHCSRDEQNVLAVIPGIALNSSDPHAFIQVMEGISGDTNYIAYPLETFQWDRRSMHIRVASSSFSLEGMDLEISDGSFHLKGRVDYHDPVGYPGTILSPGIMGWYSYVPFMECYHGIVSAYHELTGSLVFNRRKLDFTGGNGYIEKDWGTSFPEAWLWVQCNNFPGQAASLFFSVAKIPWLGSFFMGYIAFLYVKGKYHLFSTYNKSRLSTVSHEGESIRIALANRSATLSIEVFPRVSGELTAPKTGRMERRIRESNDSVVEVRLADQADNVVFHETGQRAGLEISGKIFEYVP